MLTELRQLSAIKVSHLSTGDTSTTLSFRQVKAKVRSPICDFGKAWSKSCRREAYAR